VIKLYSYNTRQLRYTTCTLFRAYYTVNKHNGGRKLRVILRGVAARSSYVNMIVRTVRYTSGLLRVRRCEKWRLLLHLIYVTLFNIAAFAERCVYSQDRAPRQSPLRLIGEMSRN